MGFFGEDSYNQVNSFDGSDEHKAKLSHELLGGAVAYEAAKGTSHTCLPPAQPHPFAAPAAVCPDANQLA